MTKEDQTLYQSLITDLLQSASKDDRDKVMAALRRLKAKAPRLTAPGKERKKRIISKVFDQRKAFLLKMNVVLTVMPMFKSFVLTFEQKCPLVHKLHDRMLDTLKFFLASFLKIENLKEGNLHKVDIFNVDNQRPLQSIFTGEPAQAILESLNPQERKSCLQKLMEAYKNCGKYLQTKLPVSNAVLKSLSCLDPLVHGHSVAEQEMENLVKFFPAVIPKSDQEKISQEIKRFHRATSTDLPAFTDKDRLDKWWCKVLPKYPALVPLLKASLSIFTGPRVEQSFSNMNNIITSKSNRLAVSLYGSYQAVKYHLLNMKKTSVELFRRDNVVYGPVDKSLVFHMQTAWQRVKKSSQKSEGPRSTTKNAHEKCSEQICAIIESASSKKRPASAPPDGLLGETSPKRHKH